MCEKLSELAEAMRAYASSFDAALLVGSDASRAVELCSRIIDTASAIRGRAAARAEDCGTWARSGDKSPAHHLARVTGTTVGHASAALDTARKLDALPELKRAADARKVSAQQAEAIASAASTDPRSERDLVAKAEKLSLSELRVEADRIKAAADRDAEARRTRIHSERSLRSYTDASGAGNLHWRDNPDDEQLGACRRHGQAGVRGMGRPAASR